jgi:uncharacterized Rmd1/YagE family protein
MPIMSPSLFSVSQSTIAAHALFLGQSIDVKPFITLEPLGTDPLVIKAGAEGCAVLFDYGAVVLFGLSPVEEVKFLSDLEAVTQEAFDQPSSETATLRQDRTGAGKLENDVILMAELDVPRLQIAADVLAKSVVLDYYELATAAVFDQIESFAVSLQKPPRQSGKVLLDQIGNTLLIQHKIVGRVEILEKPDLLWDYPQFDRLYLRLEDEYEIRERHLALEKKLSLISRTAETALDLQQHNTGLRLEWYVVILIVIEVILSLYELFVKA